MAEQAEPSNTPTPAAKRSGPPGLVFIQILLLCIGLAVVFGVLHDQVTARICIEYFTVTHPPLIDSDSPTLVGLAWGVVATWWFGLLLGVPLALACRLGREPRLGVGWVLPRIGVMLAIVALCSTAAGLYGHSLGADAINNFLDAGTVLRIDPSRHAGWVANAFAHSATYTGAGIGGVILMVLAPIDRWRRSRTGRTRSAAKTPE